MKKILSFFIMLLMPSVTFSQVLTQHFAEGEAVKNGVKVSKRMTSNGIIEMPPVDVEKLLKEDAEMAGEDVPFRFGYGFETSYTLDNGEWEDEDDGRLWSLRFKSNGAISLNFVFEDFSLPDGAYLNIVNSDETIVYGPVTSENIPKDGYFLTDVIPDSLVTIYLFEPDSQVGKSTLKIKKVVHGYQNFIVINDDNGDPGSSAPCNVPVENSFPAYGKEADAIALIIMGDGTSYCSGSLVLSTDLSFKPYLLTAFHCVNTEVYSSYYPNPYANNPTDMVVSSAEKANVNHWAIKFGYRQQSTYAITFNGADFRSGWFDSDFALVELYEDAKQFAHLTWLGWDKTSNVPSSGVGIHHPHGDYMKISIDNDPSQTSMWVESLYPNNGTLHWLEHWDSGITQQGSSGSPLLNESKRVVGQLHGVIYEGNHTIYTLRYYPCEINYASYGKFDVSWTGGGSYDSRLSDWLDPIGTGQTTMDSSHPIYIFGPTIPENSSVYSVQNLPSGYNFTWTYTPHSGTSLPFWAFIPNSPTTNQCTIDNFNKNYINGTLTATITNGATTITTLEKEIRSGDGFLATCSQPLGYIEPIYGNFENVENTSADFSDNAAFAVKKSSLGSYPVTITSPFFSNATITHTSISGLSWQHSGNTITLSYPANDNLDPVLVVTGKSSTDYRVYRFSIYSQLDIPLQLTALVQGRTVTLALTPDEATEKDYSLETLSRFVSQLSERKWDVTVTEATTGKTVYESHTKGVSHEINAAEWASGIYVIKASIGNQMLTQKIFVN